MVLTLFGGEPTLEPNFNYIVDKLNNTKVQLSLYSNCSADLDIYNKFCSCNNTIKLDLTYHPNHMSLDNYKYKLKYLLDKYPDIKFSTSFAIGKNRKTEKEILNDFNDIICKYNNHYMSLFPLITNNETNILNKNIENIYNDTNNFKIEINENDINSMYNKYTDCIYTNCYIYNCNLYRCYKYNNLPLVNLKEDNAITKYLNIIKIKSDLLNKCSFKYCYKTAKKFKI